MGGPKNNKKSHFLVKPNDFHLFKKMDWKTSKKNTGIGSSRFFYNLFFSVKTVSQTGIVIFNCKCSHNQPMYRLKKVHNYFVNIYKNSATKHLNLQNPRFEFFPT